MKPHAIPDDLAAFLRSGPRTLPAGHYEAVALVPLEQLCIETLQLTPNLAPFARNDPHRHDGGFYEVPAVNLVVGEPRLAIDFPAWLFLWLPVEGRFGSVDLDHGDLILFAPEVSWSDIVANPEAFVEASESGGNSSVPTEYLQPWPKYRDFLTEPSCGRTKPSVAERG